MFGCNFYNNNAVQLLLHVFTFTFITHIKHFKGDSHVIELNTVYTYSFYVYVYIYSFR